MAQPSPGLAGVILYPKPAGVTSHDVVAKVRRELAEDEVASIRRSAESYVALARRYARDGS